ncbi:MAG TPA: hypothetical protein VFK09_11455, partial [Gemmatimonadales bacterium]|nr:hypothetical protein [Gemmatimonadales bacterium]
MTVEERIERIERRLAVLEALMRRMPLAEPPGAPVEPAPLPRAPAAPPPPEPVRPTEPAAA